MEPTETEQEQAEAVETVHVAPVSVLSTEVAEEDEAAAAAAVTAPAPAPELVPAPPAPPAEAEPAPPAASAEEPDKTRQQRVSDALSRLPTLPTMPSFRLSNVKEARSLAARDSRLVRVCSLRLCWRARTTRRCALRRAPRLRGRAWQRRRCCGAKQLCARVGAGGGAQANPRPLRAPVHLLVRPLARLPRAPSPRARPAAAPRSARPLRRVALVLSSLAPVR
jgi:hypothetical protein